MGTVNFMIAGFTALVLVALGGAYFFLMAARLSPMRAVIIFPAIVGVAVWVVTEVLSALEVLGSQTMWVVVALASIPPAIARSRVTAGARRVSQSIRSARAALLAESAAQGRLRWLVWLAGIVALLVAVVTLFLALWGPPNNADSLAYHLPRLMHWIQAGDVDHFATPDLRMVSIPPLAGYGLVWLLGLSGSDGLLNVLQWSAYLWCATVAAGIALRLTRRWTTGLVAFTLVLVTPMGIAEATTTQSDWIAALWVVLALGLVVERATQSLKGPLYLWGFAALAALAAATKATGLLSLAVVAAGGVFLELARGRDSVRRRFGYAAGVAAAALVGALAGQLPQAIRNINTFGTPLGDTLGVVTERHDVTTLMGNVLRILINNAGVPRSIGNLVNPHLEQLFALAHLPWVDPAAVGYEHLPSISLARNEDYATNPVQMILGLVAALVIIAWPRTPMATRTVSAIGIGMLASTALVFKWNQWTNRFLLQILVVFSITLAIVLWKGISSFAHGSRVVPYVAALGLLASSVYGLFVSVTLQYRPLLDGDSILFMDRSERYFYVVGRGQKGAIEACRGAIEQASDGSRIGLRGRSVDEYLLWALLNPDRRVEFHSVNTGNATTRYELENVDETVDLSKCEASPAD